MTYNVTFWGTRGSIPTPGPQTVRYGGNTPCISLSGSGPLLILDAGSGLRCLGHELMQAPAARPLRANLLLSHTHWDHIQGIPFFAPLFHRGNHFTIWGSRSLQTSIDRVVRDQMSPVVFPVSFEELQAQIDFQELAEERRAGCGYEVAAMAVRHPGGALAYRFTESNVEGGGLVYVSDNELSAAARYETPRGWRARFVDFVRGASVLVHDTMYKADEYRNFVGWGHSTYDDAVELALEAKVRQLVLFHHHPERTDDEVDRCVASCRELVQARGAHLDVIAAAEGMTLIV